MEGYIILNNEYSKNNPMFVTRVACSTNRFSDDCIHTDEKLYNFYKEYNTHEILFIAKSKNDPRLRNIIEDLYKDKDESERKYNGTIRALNKLNEHYE